MEHPFFTSAAATRAEAIRWLTIAEKLLSARDLLGSKSFATRAREADSTLSAADEILAVVDTLLAGDRRIGNNLLDFYSILRLTPAQGGDAGLVGEQYRSLVFYLNPQRNTFPFAELAFRLVVDAWYVLSDPSRKAMYDKELGYFQQPQQPGPFSAPVPAFQQNFFHPEPQMHGGGSSGVATTYFAPTQQTQFQQPHVGPAIDGPTREPQNFMDLHQGSHEPVNNQGQDKFSTLPGYVDSSVSRANKYQLIDGIEKQIQQDYPIAGGNSAQPVFENVQDNINNEEHNIEENVENADGTMEEEEEKGEDPPANDNKLLSFWTACPYCYHMYEYPGIYVDCTMRCQNCKMAFQGVPIPSPPPVLDGQEAYFCCWGFIPLGFSMEAWKNPSPKSVNNRAPRNTGPRVYIDDAEDIFADISSSSDSDVDWRDASTRKGRTKSAPAKRKSCFVTPKRSSKRILIDAGQNASMKDGDTSKQGPEGSGRKQPNRVAKSFGKLDLNVELSKEAEELAVVGANGEKESGSKEDDSSIEGTGFFEGLDELFSNLPILNVEAAR